MRPMPFLLFPAVALVAQAPADLDLAKRFNTELPGINQMLKEFKSEEALTKMATLVPAQRPAFNGANLQTIGRSLDNAQGLMSLYRLWANVASEAGQWEKALEVQEKRVMAAKAIRVELDQAQAPISAQWEKAAQEARDFVAKSATRQPELQAKVDAFQAEYEQIKSGKRKLSKKETDDFNARANQIQQDQNELAQINTSLPTLRQNLANAPKVMKVIADNRKEADGLVKAAEEAVVKAKEALATQNDEIAKFNTSQVIKKVKVVGKKTWVDAVLRNPENVTRLSGAQAQAAFLNRLLVLDPGNAGAQKALDNLKAGKEPFAKEAKPAKKAGAKKK